MNRPLGSKCCEAWAFALSFILVLLAAVPVGAASQDLVQIVQDDAWVDFPQTVDFHLVATAAIPIDRVQIEYGVNALTCGDVTTIASPKFEAGTEVDVTWRWQIAPDRVLPPGSKIWWRWRLTANDGAEITTETQTVTFDDSWFVWQSLTEENLTVLWYRGPRSLAQDMLDAGLAALESLEADTGLRISDPIAIYLYEEPFDLKLSIPGAPDWIGGIAFPEYNTALVVANESYADYGRLTVRHELGHMVIRRFTFNCLSDIPVWLDEGLAMIAEGEPDERAVATLNDAVAEDRLLTIRQIESSFSVHASRAELSYAQSYSLVRFLVDTYGQDRMLLLLETFRQGVTPDDALLTTYGFDTPGLEQVWRAAVGASAADPGTSDQGAATPIPTLALATLPSSSTAGSPSPTPPATFEPTSPPTQPVTTDSEPFPALGWLILGGGGLCTLLAAIAPLAIWRIRRKSQ